MAHRQQESSSAIHPGSSVTPEQSYVVGVDIGGTNLRLAIADAAGTLLARWSASTEGLREAQLVVDLIQIGVDELLQQASVPRSALRAIAAGAPGITDAQSGIVLWTSYLMGWVDVPLRALLESTLGMPAAVDNDVNLAALGEHWLGSARGTSDFVFLAVGTGVGAGIILNNQLFRGAAWTAGEIGYMLVPGTSEEPAEAGMPGALESIVGGEGIRTQWHGLWSDTATSLPRDLIATAIFDQAIQGDPLAARILQQSARTLAYAIFNIALMLDCPLFVLGGSVGMHPALCEATRAILALRRAQVSPRLALSALGPDAQLIGAIRLALLTAAAHSPLSPAPLS